LVTLLKMCAGRSTKQEQQEEGTGSSKAKGPDVWRLRKRRVSE
jgi:hypothetical protein